VTPSPLRPLSSLPRAERERREAEIRAAIAHLLRHEQKATADARRALSAVGA
jgi:hypothetical protein